MTDQEYRRLPSIANSDLTELFAIKTGQSLHKANPKTLQFGATFHQMILETESSVNWNLHTVKERALILDMTKSFFRNIDKLDPDWPYSWMETEVVQTRRCPLTGLLIKGKLDSFYKPRVLDLKTTSCRDSQEFFDSILKYGYDRQAAFYLDLVSNPGYDFTFYGVQKIKPFEIFVIDMSISDDRRKMIDEGRRKNAHLLKTALAEFRKSDGWRPSSWNR